MSVEYWWPEAYRRPPVGGEHTEADLAQPAVWPAVAAHFDEALGRREAGAAVFLHMSGIGTPAGPVTDAGLPHSRYRPPETELP